MQLTSVETGSSEGWRDGGAQGKRLREQEGIDTSHKQVT
jgi:hypothetical protein